MVKRVNDGVECVQQIRRGGDEPGICKVFSAHIGKLPRSGRKAANNPLAVVIISGRGEVKRIQRRAVFVASVDIPWCGRVECVFHSLVCCGGENYRKRSRPMWRARVKSKVEGAEG